MLRNSLILVLLKLSGIAIAQNIPKPALKDIFTAVDKYSTVLSTERVYLHTDRSVYLAGDTIWLKGYLFNASNLNSSTKSGVLYVELADDSNKFVKRIMLPLYYGLTLGSITIDKELTNGRYNLRAYTSWMRNAGEEYMFKKQLYVRSIKDEDWLVNYNYKLLKEGQKQTVNLGLKVEQFDKLPIGLREMKLEITAGNKTLWRKNTETSQEGLLNIDFGLPNLKGRTLMLSMKDLRKSSDKRQLIVPLILNRAEDTDLQFMPEGGSLVANLPAHVAFKAINEDGKGVDVTGKICNSKGEEITDFKSSHEGIGTFKFLPLSNEVYSAKIKLPDETFKTYPLPAVINTGLTLTMDNNFSADSCEVTITTSADIAALKQNYYLIGHTRGLVCFGAGIYFSNGVAKLKVSKNEFPTGVAHLVLLDQNKKALNERIFYVDHADQLKIRVTAHKNSYKQRDSVALSIKVTDKNGLPVQGSFSLAATDDELVKQDNIAQGSIVSQLLLTADLKGDVENPGYYNGSVLDQQKWQDLDHLLLAQGWVAFDLSNAFKPVKTSLYAAEQEFLIKGRVVTAFNKPYANSAITLFSKKPLLVMDTVTNAQGNFMFKGVYPLDSAIYFIQAKNKKGKSNNVNIDVENFTPQVFSLIKKPFKPWYVNVDTGSYLSETKQVKLQKEQARLSGASMLKEVKITAKKIIKGSENRNGPGNADIILGEEDMIKAGKTNLGDLLAKNIKGFGIRSDKHGYLDYYINTMRMHLIIDGMDAEFFLPPGVTRREYFKDLFEYFDAAEIKGIEVMMTGKYQFGYSSLVKDTAGNFWDHTFVEVTTHSGKGPLQRRNFGNYVYRPLPFSTPAKFYAPRYTSTNSKPDMTDIRSTIFWEPDIFTDKEGKATLGFYTSDHTGSYTIIVEGSDMQGNIGTTRAQIKVVP